MSLRVILVVVWGLLLSRPVMAQASKPEPSEEKAEPHGEEGSVEDDAKKEAGDAKRPRREEKKAAPPKGEDASGDGAEPKDEPSPTPSPDPPTPSPDPPTPSPDPGSPPPTTPEPAVPAPRGHGLVVVAGDERARGEARNLARRAYRDVALRPRIDESTAQVLAGDPAPEGESELAELASTVSAVATLKDDAVRRRLLDATIRELGVQRAVLVETSAEGPRARVVEGGRFRSLTLTAVRRADDSWDWSDAVAMLRGLSVGTPAPGPRRTVAPKPKPTSTVPDEGEDDFNLLTSPWFWGGLGVVVTVGVTVFVLSRTALNEPDEVMIQGRIAP